MEPVKRQIKVVLANPRGFCAGVERAIEIVERALKKYGAPVYIKHEIVHNRYVVNSLKDKGAIFTDDIESIPNGAVVIFSAHGVSKKVEDDAKYKELYILDATCPLVKKVHREAQKYVASGRKLVLIGHKNHPEIEGTSGRVAADQVVLVEDLEQIENLPFKSDEKLAYVTQTTLSIDDTKNLVNTLYERYTDIDGPALKDICYATQNRQDAIKEMAKYIDVLLVIGATNSSNSSRLRDLGESQGVASYLIADETQINLDWFEGKQAVGITAGASAPEVLLKQVLDLLSKYHQIVLEEVDGVVENLKFKIPRELEDL
ncbi:MAG: 4-hydroxy-3-methylbut-2-enyl diphosphate reductase [Candidatus Midichloria mitochondrii]|uniref:4-hydroxy-3-methylbut-2-enyl diphosphate reductase n=1 Tax=Midichloria mitochondrii (strain IricVA) TaxID=696127 RepID=F7XVG2_MIDMI|nr:4-hydroxy-3-methylbut-2-enyl diphosphate reductase [Candidatus Midichloria mitochondrii]AEI88661.1 4-hydroxy-3-methylbut-2-enyl diphosphate reductase [Candidatus Midichloria mitochondrii IricVA]MDJ1256910.1 4-hydroxy-3-methylbut-2-enyl diphosphate reductase [Candidatus Midichloria mitochondrii]MDJ1288653.1 4-hydroxy-3-methylbut-2-enyl diphosphate reductase [Candidatus Midichloria mitochondrii]MDJ1299480.1 4-hydroxy-3-methylbut-2-enyl diphosphate reductase [Candidatus Midichloria mitochondrii